MKKCVKQVVLIMAMVIALVSFSPNKAWADVGDFETYDSGGSWSSSDWDSGSSWDYDSDWDSDYDYGGSYSSGGGYGGFIFLGDGGFMFFVILIIVIAVLAKKGYFGRPRRNPVTPYRRTTVDYSNTGTAEETIVNLITAEDPLFNKEEFLSWTRDLFIKLQYAWADRDWSVIRCFESNELFEQHSTQLERYKVNKQINKIERVSVNWAKLHQYTVAGENEVLTVMLNSKMIDYIVDEESGKILKGDNVTNKVNTYKLTFMRKKGIKTKAGETTVNTTNCPNCGAPTEITSAGKCSYCGSVITTGEYNWVLSNLERM